MDTMGGREHQKSESWEQKKLVLAQQNMYYTSCKMPLSSLFFCILQLFSAFCNAVKWIRAVAQGFQVVPTPCCFCHSPRLQFFSLKVLPKKINATASTTASATAHIANSFQVVKPTFVATAVMPEEILSRSSFCARRDLNPNLNWKIRGTVDTFQGSGVQVKC